MSERYDHCNIRSRGFDTLAVRRLTAKWIEALKPVSQRLMTSQFKDILTHTQKLKAVECIFCGVWVQDFVWNFKHRKICILRGVKNLTTYDILELWHLKLYWDGPQVCETTQYIISNKPHIQTILFSPYIRITCALHIDKYFRILHISYLKIYID